MKVKITIEEIRRYLDIETPEFPKYVAPLLNLEISMHRERDQGLLVR